MSTEARKSPSALWHQGGDCEAVECPGCPGPGDRHGRWRPRGERSLPRLTCPINNDSGGRQGRTRLPASQDNLCPLQGRDHTGGHA